MASYPITKGGKVVGFRYRQGQASRAARPQRQIVIQRDVVKGMAKPKPRSTDKPTFINDLEYGRFGDWVDPEDWGVIAGHPSIELSSHGSHNWVGWITGPHPKYKIDMRFQTPDIGKSYKGRGSSKFKDDRCTYVLRRGEFYGIVANRDTDKRTVYVYVTGDLELIHVEGVEATARRKAVKIAEKIGRGTPLHQRDFLLRGTPHRITIK